MPRLQRLHSMRFRLLSVVTALVLLGGLTSISPSVRAARADDTMLTINVHYFRFDSDYNNWDLWSWVNTGTGSFVNNAQPPIEFTGSDAFGQTASYQVDETNSADPPTSMGLIVRVNDWSNREPSTDGSGNRYLPVASGQTTVNVWVVSGNPNNFYSLEDANFAKQTHIEGAYQDSANTVTVGFNKGYTFQGGGSGFKVTDTTAHKSVNASKLADSAKYPGIEAIAVGDWQHLVGGSDWDPANQATRLKQVSGDLYSFSTPLPAGDYNYKVATGGNWNNAYPANNVALHLDGPETVTFYYAPYLNQVYDSVNDPTQALPPTDVGWATNQVTVTFKKPLNVKHKYMISAPAVPAVQVIPRNVLNSSGYIYKGALGVAYTKKATTFNVWAPTATAVKVKLSNSQTGAFSKTVALKPATNGDWRKTVKGNYLNWSYLYAITTAGTTQTAVDPYARDITVNGLRGLIINLAAASPAGWASDHHVGVANPVDASIYETDVRDFSIDPNSGVPTAHQGKYLAFTDSGTTNGTDSTGIDSVKSLGVHDIELMPTYAFNSVDETNNTQQNWGYDPRNYNVPEGQFATNPVGPARVIEYKQMVQSIHNNGMGVIFDGVYSHVADANTFNPLVNQYYLRTDNFGNYIDGTGAGPDVAIERPMIERFVEDSMKYWVSQYHIDGFRLDWMSLFGVAQLKKISHDLHAMFPGIVITGEPWLSGGDANTQNGIPASQQVTELGSQKGLGVALWNDHLRNAIRGGDFNTDQGYATGAPHGTEANEPPAGRTQDTMAGVEKGVLGSTSDFTAAPSETLNYASSHDNYALWDRINVNSDPSASMADKISMDELSQAIVLTSQGVPMILGGEEMLRTKGDNNNSYNAGDAVNQLDWSLKTTNLPVYNYYSGLFHLRAAHPAFRMTTAAQIQSNLTWLSSPDPTIAYELNGSAVGDSWGSIVVIYNPTSSTQSITLPTSTTWHTAATNGSIDLAGGLGDVTGGTASVPALTAMVLYQ